VHEDDIIAWRNYNGLKFLQCACRFTEHAADEVHASKRQEIKLLLKQLKKQNPDIEKSVFNSIHAVNLDTFPGWKTLGETHSFLEWYDERKVER
jgi:tRNA(Ile)-lysidine synthase TilS/MesJ